MDWVIAIDGPEGLIDKAGGTNGAGKMNRWDIGQMGQVDGRTEAHNNADGRGGTNEQGRGGG